MLSPVKQALARALTLWPNVTKLQFTSVEPCLEVPKPVKMRPVSGKKFVSKQNRRQCAHLERPCDPVFGQPGHPRTVAQDDPGVPGRAGPVRCMVPGRER